MTRVIYDGNGHTEGSVPVDTHEYIRDEYAVVADPGNMKRAGCAFSHWLSSLNRSSYAPGQRMFPTNTVTMRAIWKPKCTIIYDTSTGLCVNGDVPIDTSVYAIGDTVAVPPHNLITAYIAAVGKKDEPNSYTLHGMQTCIGWKILGGGVSPKDVLVSGDTFTVTDQNVVLQSVWGSPEISIAYEAGSGVEGADIPIQSAQQFCPVKIIDLPADIMKSGFEFAHWEDPITKVKYHPGEEVTFPSSILLQAVWYPNHTHSITYDLAGGTGDIPQPDPVKYGKYIALTEVEPKKDGYLFGGWLVPNGERPIQATAGAPVQVTADTTITARWVPVSMSERLHVKYYDDPDLHPFYEEKTPEDDNDYVSGDYVFIQFWYPVSARDLRRVTGWKDEKRGKVYKFGSYAQFTDGNIDLHPVWEEAPVVTVKFLPNGDGVTGSVPDITTFENSAIILPSPLSYTRTGYEAMGWLLFVNGKPTGERYENGMIYRVPVTSGSDTVIQFGVEWIERSKSHTVTYEDVLHDFGHLPVDLCEYYAGDFIPLPPAGDLRRTGYRMVGWMDRDTQKFYKIPTKAELESFEKMDDATRGDYGYLCPTAICRGDHVFRAVWVPATTIYFSEWRPVVWTAPAPVELTADEIYYLPDSVTVVELPRTYRTLVYWRDVEDGHHYPAGSKFVYTGKPYVVLAAMFHDGILVEYVVPEELNLVNTTWVPETEYVVDRNTVHVDVPLEMDGRFCWMRSDTGEKITESCDIEISGSLVLTLLPVYSDPSEYPHCILSVYYGTHVSTITTQIGRETTLEPAAGQTGWRVDGGSRIYGVNDPIIAHGNAVIQAVYGDAPADSNDGEYRLIYEMPDGANSEAPVCDKLLNHGDWVQIPPHNGMRGPNGTNLLFWYTTSTDPEKDPKEIVGRYYPGEIFVVPNVGADNYMIIDFDAKTITLHPFFGDKFGIQFADPSNDIMPLSPDTSKAEYTYPTLITDGMLVRTPQMVEGTRDAKSYEKWVVSWQYPNRGTSSTTNETIYATRFEGKILDDEYGDELGGFFSSLLTIVKAGAWLFTNVVKPAVIVVGKVLRTVCETVKKVTTSTHKYDLIGELPKDELISAKETSVDKSGLLFTSDKVSTGDVKKNVTTETSECVGFKNKKTGRIVKEGDKISHWGLNAEYVAVYDRPIYVWFQLYSKSIDKDVKTFRDRKQYIGFDWIKPDGAKCQDTWAKAGDYFHVPLFGEHFRAYISNATEHESKDGDGNYLICDRWFASPGDKASRKATPHPALENYRRPITSDDLWLWARTDIKGYNQQNTTVTIPTPEDKVYGKYFVRMPEIYKGTGEHSRKDTWSILFYLRTAPLVKITYTYPKLGSLAQLAKNDMVYVSEGNCVGSTPRLEFERDNGGHMKDFLRVIPLENKTLYFQGWMLNPTTPEFTYYDELYQKHETTFNPKVIHPSGSFLPPIRVDSPSLLRFVAKYKWVKPGETAEYEEEPVDGLEHPKHQSNVFDISNKHPNKSVDLSSPMTAKECARGQNHQNQNTARKDDGASLLSQGLKLFNESDYISTFGGSGVSASDTSIEDALAASIAAASYKTHDMYKTRAEYLESLGTPSLRRIRQAMNGIKPTESTIQEQEDAETFLVKMDNDIDAAQAEVIRAESDALKCSEMQVNQPSIFAPKGLYNRASPFLALCAEGSIPRTREKDGMSAVYGNAPMTEQAALHPDREVYIQNDIITDDSRQQTVDKLTGMVGDDPMSVPNHLISPVLTARLQLLGQYIRDQHTQMFGLRPSLTRLRSGYILVDADEDTDAKARRVNPGWSKTLSVATRSTKNKINIPMLVYTPPRWAVNDYDVYFPGDTVVVPAGKRLCRVDYVWYGVEYDDNIPGLDPKYRTYDDKFYEPYEYHTVLKCMVPDELCPKDKQFGGWILESYKNYAVSYPGDMILQENHTYRYYALWTKKPSSRFGDVNV